MTAPDSLPSDSLGRVLAWLVERSDGTLTSRELAELLWLIPRLPAPPSPSSKPPKALPSPIPEAGTAGPGDSTPPPPQPSPDQTNPPSAPEPIDPHWPAVFPEATIEAAASQEPLLPLAVLPRAADVAELQASLSVRVAQSPPLGDRASLLKALRPLLRRRPDPLRSRLHEERTAEAWAETGLLLPVLQPGHAPWFEEVLILVDAGLSMRVWHGVARELGLVLASSQVFPRVRLRFLSAEAFPAGTPKPSEGSLLLLVSDAAGSHWWDGGMFDLLEDWCRRCPTAILQLLPPWQWDTALAVGEQVTITNTTQAGANSHYSAERLDWWEMENPPLWTARIPVIPVDHGAFATWSAVVMGEQGYAIGGVALPDEASRSDWLTQRLAEAGSGRAGLHEGADPTASDLWSAFCRSATPQAQRLLMVMATAPVLTLPVIGLLHEAKVHGSTSPLPIAEVLVSHLVRCLPDQDDVVDPSELQFALVPELAELLLSRLAAVDRLDVIRTVSALVERRWNGSIAEPSFQAALLDPTLLPEERLREGVVQFASVTARLLDTLPGEKARAFAERIRRGSGLAPASPWPPSMAFEERAYKTARLVETPPLETITFSAGRLMEIALHPLPFKSARVEPDGPLQRWVGEALAFHEPLQREALPFGATAERADPLALTLVELRAGSFEMGSAEDEEGSHADEKPRHTVRLPSFFMGQTPITQAQWRVVAGWKEREGKHIALCSHSASTEG